MTGTSPEQYVVSTPEVRSGTRLVVEESPQASVMVDTPSTQSKVSSQKMVRMLTKIEKAIRSYWEQNCRVRVSVEAMDRGRSGALSPATADEEGVSDSLEQDAAKAGFEGSVPEAHAEAQGHGQNPKSPVQAEVGVDGLSPETPAEAQGIGCVRPWESIGHPVGTCACTPGLKFFRAFGPTTTS